MASEQRGFIFAVVFIVIFSVLLSTIPVDLQGVGATPDMIIPLEPSLITGFAASETYTYANFTYYPVYDFAYYLYELGGRTWEIQQEDDWFLLGAHVLYGGFLWLGQYDYVNFISVDGANRGNLLTFDEIEADADNGTIRYNLQYITGGSSAGGFVVYWNTTTYATAILAWNAEKLYFVHGVGFAETATSDIGSLLISLLLLQLPDVPLLVNILLVTPIWASIIFVLWYIIKEMIPFV